MNEFFKVNKKLNKSKSNLDNCPLTADEIADGFEELQWKNHSEIRDYIFSDEKAVKNDTGRVFSLKKCNGREMINEPLLEQPSCLVNLNQGENLESTNIF